VSWVQTQWCSKTKIAYLVKLHPQAKLIGHLSIELTRWTLICKSWGISVPTKIFWKYCGYYVFTAHCNVLPKDWHEHVQQSSLTSNNRMLNNALLGDLWIGYECTHQNLSFIVARTKMNAFSLLPTRQMQTTKQMRGGIMTTRIAYTAMLNCTNRFSTRQLKGMYTSPSPTGVWHKYRLRKGIMFSVFWPGCGSPPPLLGALSL
jgi:hypothetical protein